MSAKLLVLGFDGFDPSLVERFGSDLPNLKRIAEQGVFAPLESVKPCATLPNWSTFLTTSDPGVHGVFDFTLRTGYSVRFAAGTVRQAPTMFRRMDAMGLQTACIGFPATWPPEPLRNGMFIAGWDSPVDFEADASFMWPRSLHAELRARFGPWRFDDADEFHADANGFYDTLGDTLVRRVERKSDVASWLLAQRAWDVFAFYFGESDTVAHHLWAHFDESSPRHPAHASEAAKSGLPRVYRALDAALGRLREEAGENANVVIVSDHGSGGANDKVLFLNRQLAQMGLLTFAPSTRTAWTKPLKDFALRKLSPRWRQRIFRSLGRALPGWLESQNRFGDIDFSRTQAFSDELNYFPSISLNVRGREPLGTVDPADRERVMQSIREGLLAIKDPWTGEQVLEAVHAREAVYSGPFVHRAPDLILQFRLDGKGHSYNLMPSRLAADSGAWMRLPASELLGRKGRSLPGSHRSHGVFFAAGPGVTHARNLTPTMADASQTVLALAKVAAPLGCAGQALSPHDEASSDQALVEERLRALGYVE